jgi:flagellar assembly protein FliH
MKWLSRIMKNVKMQPIASIIDYGNSRTIAAAKHAPDKEAYGRIIYEHILNTAEVRAQKIFAEAQEKSRLLFAQTETELKQLRKQAQEEGFAAGYQEGEKAAARLREEAKALLERAQEERAAIVAAAETDIIALGLRLAEKIINHQLQVNPNFLLAMLKACNVDAADEPVMIRVNPQGVSILQENGPLLAALFPQGGYQIKPDPEVEQGFILETEKGVVDARTSSQLQELAKTLGEVMVGD